MRLCRFDEDRLGWVQGDLIHDVTPVLARLPALRWPLPAADPLWDNLPMLRSALEAEAARGRSIPLERARLLAPVSRAGKIVAVRRNRAGLGGDRPDVFLKAPSAIAGPYHGVRVPPLGRACECELELALVVGRADEPAVGPAAIPAVAGYCLALDLAVAGDEDRALRKSADSFCILGPWVTEGRHLPDLDAVELTLRVNGEPVQHGRIADQPFRPGAILAYVARFMSLAPGDVVLAGCPAAPTGILPGDVLDASSSGLGRMEVRVHAADGVRCQR